MLQFHFTPTSASWLNQVEVWFSILQGQSLSGTSFTSLKQLQEHIDAYVNAYNDKAKPFVWTKKKVRQRRFKGRRITQLLFRVLGRGVCGESARTTCWPNLNPAVHPIADPDAYNGPASFPSSTAGPFTEQLELSFHDGIAPKYHPIPVAGSHKKAHARRRCGDRVLQRLLTSVWTGCSLDRRVLCRLRLFRLK